MKPKYTPGPWQVGSKLGLELRTSLQPVYAVAGELPTAYVCTASVPDAQLISAAPDMLETLEAALVWFETNSERFVQKPEDHVIFDQMLFAVLKANGKFNSGTKSLGSASTEFFASKGLPAKK